MKKYIVYVRTGSAVVFEADDLCMANGFIVFNNYKNSGMKSSEREFVGMLSLNEVLAVTTNEIDLSSYGDMKTEVDE